jgi:hypothetical protein
VPAGVLVRRVVSADKPETCSLGIIIVPIMKLWNYVRRISIGIMLSRKTGSDMRIGSVSTSYTEGPVTEVDYIRVEYGHFEDYIDWLNSTWKPTMEAFKKAGLIIDYKVLKLTPKSPDQPNISLNITFKNGAAAFDKGIQLEEVAKKAIGSTEVQNKARVGRNDYRRVLGNEYVRELILK